MAQESLLNTNWNSGDEIAASELNAHGQEHLDLDGHGDAFHAVQYLKSLAGGNGIAPNSIGDGDTLSINLSDIAGNNLSVDTTNNELDATGDGISSLSGGNGIAPGSIGDGDTLSVTWSDASDLTSGGDIGTGVVSEPELNVDPFIYDPGMTEFESGLSNEEINRTVLQSGEQLVVERVEFRQKGSGSSTSASIDVVEVGASIPTASAGLGTTQKDVGTTGQAVTVLIQVSNSTGSTINAAPRVQGYITGV